MQLEGAQPGLSSREVLVINRDTPAESRRLRQATGFSGLILLDPRLGVVRQYDMEVKPGQPMGGMRGFPKWVTSSWTRPAAFTPNGSISTSVSTPTRSSRC